MMGELRHDTYSSDGYSSAGTDDDEKSGNLTSWQSHYKLVCQLHQARIEVLGSDKYLSNEEEYDLATIIQTGLKAIEYRDEMGDEYDGRYNHEIECAEKARYTLVVANLPFAAYYARASVGKVLKDNDDDLFPAFPGSERSYVGTYSDVKNLVNPWADIDDRTQVAMEAMWLAAYKYKPGRGAKFSSFAAWYLHRNLQRSTASEYGGWYVSDDLMRQYREALELQELHGETPEFFHQSLYSGASLHRGYPPEMVIAGRKSVAYEAAGHWHAPEEDCPGFEGGASKLSLAEVISTHYDTGHLENEVMETIRSSHIRTIIRTILKERQAIIVEMYFGLDGGDGKTYVEIGKCFGISRARVGQILQHALSILANNQSFIDAIGSMVTFEENAIPCILPTLVDGALNLKTHRFDTFRSNF